MSDGSMFFLLHLVSKMRPPVEGGSRFGVVLDAEGEALGEPRLVSGTDDEPRPPETLHGGRLKRVPISRIFHNADIGAYFQREVLPHAPDAWIVEEKSKVGCEIIPFNRHFYVFEPPRSLLTIDEDLKAVSARIVAMLGELAE